MSLSPKKDRCQKWSKELFETWRKITWTNLPLPSTDLVTIGWRGRIIFLTLFFPGTQQPNPILLNLVNTSPQMTIPSPLVSPTGGPRLVQTATKLCSMVTCTRSTLTKMIGMHIVPSKVFFSRLVVTKFSLASATPGSMWLVVSHPGSWVSTAILFSSLWTWRLSLVALLLPKASIWGEMAPWIEILWSIRPLNLSRMPEMVVNSCLLMNSKPSPNKN